MTTIFDKYPDLWQASPAGPVSEQEEQQRSLLFLPQEQELQMKHFRTFLESITTSEPLELIKAFEQIEAEAILHPTSSTPNKLKAVFDSISGCNWNSLEDNQAVTKAAQRTMKRMGLRVKCPTCGAPSNLRCIRSGRTLFGAFQFAHSFEGRFTYHAGTVRFPGDLKLVPASAQRQRKSSKK